VMISKSDDQDRVIKRGKNRGNFLSALCAFMSF
jgi:hypothetical protein